jgi:nitronate monooxygenase
MMHDHGASGVQMATRFVATHECDASDKFKQAYIEAQEKDIRIIKSPVGLPGRALRNMFLDKVDRGEKHPYTCPYHCIKTCDYQNSPYCIAHALLNAQKGQFNSGFAFAGSNVYRVDKITSVHALVDELLAGYAEEAEKRAAI